MVQPVLARAAVRIREDKHFKFLGQLPNGGAQIIYLFAAALRPARDDDMGFRAGLRSNAFDDAVRGVGGRGKDEEHFIVLMVELAKGDKISLQAGLEASAGAEYRGARGVKARVGPNTAAHIAQPLPALTDQIEAKQDLHSRQEIKESLHAGRE